ncbi:SDR family oxidoreductase [Dactylosporangium sp. CA-233914]|uniref:SDR family oxidoreductase n=1 Tax=Dactylosporangium sp. CA-233914 TaxID=3239934 RepID=UPI003D94B98F
MRCLVTGATGYVGGRLVPRLLAAGHDVRCLTRDPRRLRDVPWAARVEIVEGDVSEDVGLAEAMRGIEVAYYLVHALGQESFEDVDRLSALNFAIACEAAGVERIVYLGGPVPPGRASAHLRSRGEVGDIFLRCAVPATVLRAAVIIGSGSASFEMLRYLTERLPVMVTPAWVRNRIQPIAIRDVLRYLVAAATVFPPPVNRAFDIGGPDVLTYAGLMQQYAAIAGLRRRILIPVRVLTPSLSSRWVGLVTPVPNRIAHPLVGSLIHEAVCTEHDIAHYVPDPHDGLTGFDNAVRLALRRIRDAGAETSWANATLPGAPSDPLPSDPAWSGGSVYRDERAHYVAAAPDDLWRVIEAVGGENGWYSCALAWSVRGWLDRLAGGVGLRRGRRDPEHLLAGEVVDFWRVEQIVPGELLRLRAEMRMPGHAWLEMRAAVDEEGRTVYEQRLVFLPRGLAGHVYWLVAAPFHPLVFGRMARNVARAAERPGRDMWAALKGVRSGAARRDMSDIS